MYKTTLTTTLGPKFQLGQMVATPGALEALARNEQYAKPFLYRHSQGDWGDIDDHDKTENDWSLENDARILSAYHLKDNTKIWIISENDRSATTILLPNEY
jgi:hypothetical protein